MNFEAARPLLSTSEQEPAASLFVNNSETKSTGVVPSVTHAMYAKRAPVIFTVTKEV